MRLGFLMSLQVVAILVATGLVVPASVAGQSTDAGWTLPSREIVHDGRPSSCDDLVSRPESPSTEHK